MCLFKSWVRDDPTPIRVKESTYDFLNRVAGPDWDHTRDILNDWINAVPYDNRTKIIGEIRSANKQQVHSLLWHLSVYNSFLKQDIDVDFEPRVGDNGSGYLTPDLMITRNGISAIVEATVVFSNQNDSQGEKAQYQIEEHINGRAANIRFDGFIYVDYINTGLIQKLKLSKITNELIHWIDNLTDSSAPSVFDVREEGWWIRFSDMQVRGRNPGERLIVASTRGSHMMDASVDSHLIRDTVREKTRKYKHLGFPIIVAIQIERWHAGDRDIRLGLYGDWGPREAINREGWIDSSIAGDFDGVWATKKGPDRQWSPALIAFGGHFESALADEIRPLLWINPWGDHDVSRWFNYDQMVADSEAETGIRLKPFLADSKS